MEKGKTVSSSQVEMTELVLPNDTNLLGNLLGGRLMHWIDIAGAMAASRHSNRVVATVTVENTFKHPARMGNVVTLKAKLSWVGRTSMEVIVDTFAENYLTGETNLVNEAFMTYVALDDAGKPTPVPPLILATDLERKNFRLGAERRQNRVARN